MSKTQKKRRKRLKKGDLIHQGYLLVVVDRTDWKEHNVIIVSLVWGTHALPIYWQLLDKQGQSETRAP
jgi:hypothetical protein